jgi:hypothetical protein
LPPDTHAPYDRDMLAVVGNVVNALVTITLFAATIRAKKL